MAIAEPPFKVKTLTWETYLSEEDICRRYDIIDGERLFMSTPTPTHQDVLS